ncbi:hypothetical protein ANCDUO_06295 [Ancylostoma duodenale]|uniref:Reverse transcriptase domain-containing protein n=1 Tax=Ancylostoma duodenale TaxID=51022 RepID=A0A0C2D220_9BILA|nr:hypothetical protein ANCDUO_06295 [Ancylostoma duodenale]
MQLKRNDGLVARTMDQSQVARTATVTVCTEEEVPSILAHEVRNALEKMKIGKTPGPDHITVEMLVSGYHVLII